VLASPLQKMTLKHQTQRKQIGQEVARETSVMLSEESRQECEIELLGR
jgi:hypothetical protein